MEADVADILKEFMPLVDITKGSFHAKLLKV